MKRYYKEIDGVTVFYRDPLIVDGMQIYNPSEELLLAAGWMEYTPPPAPEPEPIDTTIYEPDEYAIVEKLKQLAQAQVAQQTDEEALNNIELFPTWQSKLGVQVQQGERLTLMISSTRYYRPTHRKTTGDQTRQRASMCRWWLMIVELLTIQRPIKWV